jgi:hypothetical protein
VIAQILMMRRKLESWWVWLLVNTVAVPLYYSRGLHLTSILRGLLDQRAGGLAPLAAPDADEARRPMPLPERCTRPGGGQVLPAASRP